MLAPWSEVATIQLVVQIIMDYDKEHHSAKLIRAHNHILNETFSFVKSMSLKCAIDLCIPDVIHNYGQPMPLSLLTASLPIHPSKTSFISRLMQILIHSGFFSQHSATENEQEVSYVLTDASTLLLKDHPLSMTALLQVALDPLSIHPLHKLSTWFTNEDTTAFHTQNGVGVWDFTAIEPKFNHFFNEGMACDTRLVSSVVIENCKEVFEGLESLVDVGGGTGTMAKAIASSFPQLKCIVFDLPRVVADLQGTENLKYVGGDMFEAIPSADSIMLKCILHNWNDEECLKILKNCKEAITNQVKGKVLIIDMVMGIEKANREFDETKLFYDIQMMSLFAGKERNEKEWATLIYSAGFSNYKIIPALGVRSIIEVYL